MKAKDLAKKLGVSPATVSLVLNNKPGISQSLRQKLLKQIEELGCQDMMCDACKTGQAPGAGKEESVCPVIAYLIYTSSDEKDQNYAFYPAVMEGAEMEARESHCCLAVIHRNQEGNVSLSTLLRRAGNVTGAVIQAAVIDERVLRDVNSLRVPFVFVDFYRPDLHFSGVCVNNEQGIFDLVKYLKEKGHKNIGYVCSEGFGESLRERKRCFHSALREYGLEDRPENYFASAWDTENNSSDFRRLADQFAAAKELPTVLVAEDDSEAVQILLALRHLGLRVPEDVSVTGFDDSVLCNMTYPRLTSVKNYRHLMGQQCVGLLHNLIHLRELGVKHPCLKVEIATKLVERGSVRDLTKGQ